MSMWHCNKHGFTGPEACCSEATRSNMGLKPLPAYPPHQIAPVSPYVMEFARAVCPDSPHLTAATLTINDLHSEIERLGIIMWIMEMTLVGWTYGT